MASVRDVTNVAGSRVRARLGRIDFLMNKSTSRAGWHGYRRIRAVIVGLLIVLVAGPTWAAGRSAFHVGAPEQARAGFHGLDVDQRALDEWPVGEVGEM